MEGRFLNKQLIYTELQRNKLVLEQYGVNQIGLFGSFVRDEGTADSDIDFLVDFEPGKKTFDNFYGSGFFS